MNASAITLNGLIIRTGLIVTLVLTALLLYSFIRLQKQNSHSGILCHNLLIVVNDAPTGFKNIRGKRIKSIYGSEYYSSKVRISKDTNLIIVREPPIIYQSNLFNSENEDSARVILDGYKYQLKKCLKIWKFRIDQHYGHFFGYEFENGGVVISLGFSKLKSKYYVYLSVYYIYKAN